MLDDARSSAGVSVADAFDAARIREHEERCALAARRALVRDARAPRARGASAGVRTPFQRDRDRIVHSKPFRRLKGKTQVFIDPAGDHYRTRMTHTLETTGDRPRRRPRAAAERGSRRGDRARPRHGPHAVRPRRRGGARRRRCASASARGFRHNEQSLRIAERLNLTTRCATGSSRTPASGEPETLEGKIVRIVDRVAYINHDIDDAIRYGILERGDLPRDEIERARRRRGSTRIDTLVHDLVETSDARGRHRPERRGRRRDALAAGVHVRARLPRPEHARPSTSARARRDPADLRRRSPTAATSPTRSPSSSPA